MDFKTKSITRDQQGHFIVIKVINQKDIIIINLYASNNKASKYTKKIFTEIEKQTIPQYNRIF